MQKQSFTEERTIEDDGLVKSKCNVDRFCLDRKILSAEDLGIEHPVKAGDEIYDYSCKPAGSRFVADVYLVKSFQVKYGGAVIAYCSFDRCI